jgi:hypothetical protein
MPTCPDGHQSASADFCDTCGMRIEGAPAPPPPAPAAPVAGGPDPGAAEGDTCPQCGTEKSGQFCEVCGFSFVSGTPAAQAPPAAVPVPSGASTVAQPEPAAGPEPAAASLLTGAGEISTNQARSAPAAGPSWTAIVTADRDYYDAVVAASGPDADSIEFPAYCPERRFTLTGQEMRIGRRSASRGLEPEIDLTGPPTDPGISHLHAVLIAQPDGTWSVLDPGSSNGTQLNGDDLVTGAATPLNSGDRVCVGAWTVLTIQAP